MTSLKMKMAIFLAPVVFFAAGYWIGRYVNKRADEPDKAVNAAEGERDANRLENHSSKVSYDNRIRRSKNCSIRDFHSSDVINRTKMILKKQRISAANDFIKNVGIVDEVDQKRIRDSYLEGCTRFVGYNGIRNVYSFKSPDNSITPCENSIGLKDDYDVSPQLAEDSAANLVDEQELSADELRYRQMLKEEKASEVVRNFDLSTADLTRGTNLNEGNAEVLRDNLESVRRVVARSEGPAKKAEVVCKFDDHLNEFLEDHKVTGYNPSLEIFLEALRESVGTNIEGACFDAYRAKPTMYDDGNGNVYELYFF
ncbi:MAG: hypothetical protein JXR76_31970 [Deltaproteobacteria bacterium]|nr:hypothetical protein [Deltaproteobacteria bacterium]